MSKPRKINITNIELIEFYINKKLTITNISKLYNCSYITIQRRLKEFKINIRRQGWQQYYHFKGKNNPNFKGGLPSCLDCHKQLSRRDAKRCKTCMGVYLSGKNSHMYGKNLSGINSPRYIDGRTSIARRIRRLKEDENWRTEVFKRDNYTCQECFKRGSNLNSHHVNKFKYILSDFLKEYDQFSPIEDKDSLVRLAIKYKPFWNLNNGKTLCTACHKLEHKNSTMCEIKKE